MANLSQGTAVNRRFGFLENSNGNAAAAAAAAALQQQQQQQTLNRDNRDRKAVEQLLVEITDRDLRENAIYVLSKLFGQAAKRDVIHEMIPLLWHSVGCIAALLQEIVSIYPYLLPPNLSVGASNRVSNALALLQSVASHKDTRLPFLNAHIPLYLYPFLNTTSKTKPFEYLRLTSLGVIGALVKDDDIEVINFLLPTEIIPLSLRAMEAGDELSKTVATFVLQKILMHDVGLEYITHAPERFYAVGQVLAKMLTSPNPEQPPSIRLLKNIIRCYLRLSVNPRACEALRDCLPGILREPAISQYFRDDQGCLSSLQQLLRNVYGARKLSFQSGGGLEHLFAG
ncbi:hypothetical protein Scep_028814 [Stephania cephalantha]|uniref:Cell differentiation protein rcd1 n=1 Tax=Stephania cephalantha TaxID=152367 RepID=A0AAP0EF83_9MAGN